jgi:hypothetical protein
MASLSSFLLSIVEKIYISLKEKEINLRKKEVTNIKNDYSLNCFLNDLKLEDTIKDFIKIKADPSVQIRKTASMPAPGQSKMKSKDIRKIEPEVKQLLVDSYREWNIGGYSQVITNALKALEALHISLTQKAWQTFRGYYNLENSLRTDAAFKEVQDNVIEWGWTYKNQSNPADNKHSQKNKTKLQGFDKKEDFDETANIISQSVDPYRHNFDKIMETLKTLKKIHKMHKEDLDQKEHLHSFEKLEIDISAKILKIDDKVLKLEPADNDTDWKIDGKIIPKIDIDSKKWIVDINSTMSSIYCLFGSNKYREAHAQAQKLLEDVEKAHKLLNKIK